MKKKITNLFGEKPKKKKPVQKQIKAALKTHSKVRKIMMKKNESSSRY